MMIPVGRRYQIDYMFGLRYMLSPKYRAKVRSQVGNNPGMLVLYMFGGLISVGVLMSALLLLTLAIEGLVN